MRVRDDEQVGKKEEGTTCTIKGKKATHKHIYIIYQKSFILFSMPS